jgi:hypothetical protein
MILLPPGQKPGHLSLLWAFALATVIILPCCTTTSPASRSESYGITCPAKVDLLVFSDCYDSHSMRGLNWVRSAKSTLKDEIREYVEIDAADNYRMKSRLGVTFIPLVIVVRDGNEIARFEPTSKSQVIFAVRKAVYD